MLTISNPLNIKQRTLSSALPLIQYENSFCMCGQPQKKDLEELKKEGWDLILNLRNPEELESLDFQMDQFCDSLDLHYKLIPVFQNKKLSKEAFQKIHDMINSGDYKKIVIHCASGRRAVLALLACFLLSKKCQLKELPNLAHSFNFQSPQMLSHLQELLAD